MVIDAMKYLIIISFLMSGCIYNYDAIKNTRDKFVKDMDIEHVSCEKPSGGDVDCVGLLKGKPVDFECYEDMCRWIYPHI